MTGPNDQSVTLGQRLTQRGWLQGAMFRASEVTCPCFVPSPTNEDSVTCEQRQLKNREMYVVISQDCDIECDERLEPVVEAMLCAYEKKVAFVEAIERNRNSARWFVVDPARRLVARAYNRVLIKKEVLARLEDPTPWPRGNDQLNRFREWLAMRYDRPALEAHIEEMLQRPVQSALDRLGATSAPVYRQFWRTVNEFLVSGPSLEDPPYTYRFDLLLEGREIEEESLSAIRSTLAAIEDAVSPDQVRLLPFSIRIPDTFSLSDYRSTWRMPLDVRPEFLDDEPD